jgi:hypothetical protein
MSIILDLFAIRIYHNTQPTREVGCAGGQTSAREELRRPDPCTRPRAGSFRRCISRQVVQCQALGIREDGLGCTLHRCLGSLHNRC